MIRPSMAETVLRIAGMLPSHPITHDELANVVFRKAEQLLRAEYVEEKKMKEWIDLGGEA